MKDSGKQIFIVGFAISLVFQVLTGVAIVSKNKQSEIKDIYIIEIEAKNDSLSIELDYCSKANKINYNNCIELQSECDKWTTYATRMKRICGVPDTIDLSYKVKCQYHVETRNLVGKNAIFK